MSETVCFGEVLLVGGGAIALKAHLPFLRGLAGLRPRDPRADGTTTSQ